MGASKEQQHIREEFQRPVEQLAAKLLPLIARRKMANNVPYNAGSSYFYEVDTGWETDMLRKDEDTKTVRNVMELEKAFTDPKVKVILVPYYSSVSRAAALRVCRNYGQGKTVFFEVNDHA